MTSLKQVVERTTAELEPASQVLRRGQPDDLANAASKTTGSKRNTTIGSGTLPDVSYEIITTRAGFDALEPEWNDLYERAGKNCTVFQSFNWHWHWCNHFLGGDAAAEDSDASGNKGSRSQLSIITIRRAGRLVMIWPLVMTRVAGLRQLAWIGAPVSQYGDVLAEGGADTNKLLHLSFQFIKQNGGADVIYLRKVRADALVAPLLEAEGLTVLEEKEAVSHDLAKDGDFETYSKRHKPRAQRNRRRQLRRMEEQGKVEFKFYPPGKEARDITKQALAMKRIWLAEKGQVSSAFAHKNFDDFFADVTMGASHSPGACVSVLTCGDKIAAVEIGLNGKTTRYMHIIVYNMEFERFAAGAQHMAGSIKHAFDSKLETFDLLAPNTRYKTDWADNLTKVRDYAIGTSAKGKAYIWAYLKNLRPKMKAAVAALPKSVKRILPGL